MGHEIADNLIENFPFSQLQLLAHVMVNDNRGKGIVIRHACHTRIIEQKTSLEKPGSPPIDFAKQSLSGDMVMVVDAGDLGVLLGL